MEVAGFAYHNLNEPTTQSLRLTENLPLYRESNLKSLYGIPNRTMYKNPTSKFPFRPVRLLTFPRIGN
jgi:hypothetical protein